MAPINEVFDNFPSLTDIVNLTNCSGKKLSVLHINIRSARKNWGIFITDLLKSSISWDVIILTEINIREEEAVLYCIDGYDSFEITRSTTKRGGGILAFVKVNLNAVCNKKKLNLNDIMELKLEFDSSVIYIVAIYRQPSSNKIEFIKELNNYLTENNYVKNALILGDMNIDILETNKEKPDKLTIEKYQNLVAFHGYENMINTKTRDDVVAGVYNESCIDHILWKHTDFEGKGATVLRKVADHYYTAFWMWNDHYNQETENEKNKPKRKLNNKKIIHEMQNINWNCLDKGASDPNEIYSDISNIINRIYKNNTIANTTTNDKKKNCCVRRSKWITDDLIDAINCKNKLWKEISKGNKNDCTQKVSEYKKLKKQLQKNIICCKNKYYKDIIDDPKTDKRKMWNQINEIIGNKKPESIDNSISKTFSELSDYTICKKFNDNFVELVPKLRKQYDKRKIRFKNNLVNNIQKRSNTMMINYATDSEIVEIIESMKPTYAVGADEFLLTHFKNSKVNSAICITKLINSIIDSEIWPSELKIQITRPIYKKGCHKDVENYRPISILPVINKIIEKYFANKIQTF
jgi:hypothetical protein